MRISAALLALLSVSCAPLLSTYVAPPSARKLTSSEPEVSAQMLATRENDNVLTFGSADLPLHARDISFECPDGMQVHRIIVSDNIDGSRALLGGGLFVLGGLATVGDVVLYADAHGASEETPAAIALAEAALATSLGAFILLFGWHPAPAALLDTYACDGHETAPPAAAIPAAPPLP